MRSNHRFSIAAALFASISFSGLPSLVVAQNTDKEKTPTAVKPEEAKPEKAKPEEAKPDLAKPDPAKPKPGLPEPAIVADEKVGVLAPKKKGKIQFSFVNQPWGEAIKWFASESGLSLEMSTPPPGSITYIDPEEYTATGAIDVINGILLTKGFVLVRHHKMLMVIRSEDIPDPLIPLVTEDDLKDRGRFELVKVLLSIKDIAPDKAQQEITKLIGPHGKVEVLPETKQVLVREMAGRLQTIRAVIKGTAGAGMVGQIQIYTFKHVAPDQVLGPVRQLMGISSEAFTTVDNSFRMAIDSGAPNILYSGKQEQVAQFLAIVEKLDVPIQSDGSVDPFLDPKLAVYPILAADPQSVLLVLQTLMEGEPDVRLAVDPISGKIIAHANEKLQERIKAAIDQLQGDELEVEVIQLRRIDPALAVIMINNLFGVAEGDTKNTAPKVDVEPITRQLLIRGTKAQIDQIRQLLKKMGEDSGEDGSGFAGRGKMRVIPLTGRSAQRILQQIEHLWPAESGVKIRIVAPPNSEIPTRGGTQDILPDRQPPALDKESPDDKKTDTPAKPDSETKGATTRKPSGNTHRNNESKTTAIVSRRITLVAYQDDASKEGGTKAISGPKKKAALQKETAPKKLSSGKKSEIVIVPTPGGLIIRSDDLDALDQFEDLLYQLSDLQPQGTEFTFFYLKFARAEAVADTLSQVFGGGDSGGGSMLGDLAGGLLGGGAGGIMGGLLAGGGDDGGDLFGTGPLIIPDTRLNALIVRGSADDIDTIEQLLKQIDKQNGPTTVQVTPRPKFIQVVNMAASDIAQTVREMYADRVSGGTQRQPTPQELIQALRGGRGGQRNQQKNDRKEAEKINIGVDTRRNRLIVAAPDQMFEEIEDLVKELDQAPIETTQTMRIITVNRANPAVIQQALSAIVGSSVQSNNTRNTSTNGGRTSSRGGSTSGGRPGQSTGKSGGQNPGSQAQQQQRAEFFRRILQGQQGGGDRGRGGRGGSSRGGSPQLQRGGGGRSGRSRSSGSPRRGR